MTRAPAGNAGMDQVVGSLQTALAVMAEINGKADLILKQVDDKTVLLLKRIDTISEGLSRVRPAAEVAVLEERAQVTEAQASRAADAPFSDQTAAQAVPLPSPANPEDDPLTARLVPTVVQKVIDQIQPLLSALEKIRDERASAQPKTDLELIAEMRDAMQLRVGRRRGVLPTIQK